MIMSFLHPSSMVEQAFGFLSSREAVKDALIPKKGGIEWQIE